MNAYETTGTYGSDQYPCNIFVYGDWYCVEDSMTVNATTDLIEEGCDVEYLQDYDTCTSNDEIETLDQLIAFIDDDEPEQNLDSMTIEINNFDNASMVDNSREETIRILKGIISNIENYGVLNCDGLILKDINGNSIGNMSVIEKF